MGKALSELNILVIGLGSMGKRRIRNLKANGVFSISGFDIREDRRSEVRNSYDIPVFDEIEKAFEKTRYDAWIISVPPDVHHIYLKKALQSKTPAFVEACVVDTGMNEIIRE